MALQQLLSDPLAGDYRPVFCWAIDAEEARAEKVRAACTRVAIRDFYELARLAESGADFGSKSFIALLDAKLAELDRAPLREQTKSFELTQAKVRTLEATASTELAAVLRTDAPTFDLVATIRRFDRFWEKRSFPLDE